MLYATSAELQAELPPSDLASYTAEGEDAEIIANGGVIPPEPLALIERALADASLLVDSYIMTRYPTLEVCPPVLSKACVRIAISYLVDRKFIGVREMTEWSAGVRSEQIRLLEQISKGIVSLGVTDKVDEKSEVKICVSSKKRRLGDIFED